MASLKPFMEERFLTCTLAASLGLMVTTNNFWVIKRLVLSRTYVSSDLLEKNYMFLLLFEHFQVDCYLRSLQFLHHVRTFFL